MLWSADKYVLISRDQLFSIDELLSEVELFPKESWVISNYYWSAFRSFFTINRSTKMPETH